MSDFAPSSPMLMALRHYYSSDHYQTIAEAIADPDVRDEFDLTISDLIQAAFCAGFNAANGRKPDALR